MEKKKRIRFFPWIAMTAVFLAFAGGAAAETVEKRCEDLVLRYGARTEARAGAAEYRDALESRADRMSPYELWRSLFRPGTEPEKGAANALSLLSLLVKDGDPARWDSAAGFLYPSETPKPLAAADAVYMAALYLLRMEEDMAGHLAASLFEGLLQSSRAKHFFLTTGPAEYGVLVSEMTARGLLPSFGKWPESAQAGRLPFAALGPGLGDPRQGSFGGYGFSRRGRQASVERHIRLGPEEGQNLHSSGGKGSVLHSLGLKQEKPRNDPGFFVEENRRKNVRTRLPLQLFRQEFLGVYRLSLDQDAEMEVIAGCQPGFSIFGDRLSPRTQAPFLTRLVLLWLYRVTNPLPWSMVTVFPKPRMTPEKMTLPDRTARMGVPGLAGMSMPS